MGRRDIFNFVHEEAPYLYHYNSDIADAFEQLLENLNHLSRVREGIRQILAKKSLSVEQKLTFIQALVGEVEEDLPGDIAHGDFNEKVFKVLFEGRDLAALEDIA